MRDTSEQTIEVMHGVGAATHAVIWLHGLGASSSDFPPVVPHLGLAAGPVIRFIFPQAPDRPITINNGMTMPGWYDIKGMDLVDKEDRPGMTESQATLEGLIQQQIEQGVPSENIIVAGFSQGGAVAYYTGLRTEHKLAGVLALSTYMPFLGQAEAEQTGKNQGAPIMAMHGLMDPVVPIATGKASAEGVRALGYNVEWKVYQMEHNVIQEQLEDIGRWINTVFMAG